MIVAPMQWRKKSMQMRTRETRSKFLNDLIPPAPHRRPQVPSSNSKEEQ